LAQKALDRTGCPDTEIDGPVFATAISTRPSSARAEMSTRPPAGVNLTACERRLKTTGAKERENAKKGGGDVELIASRAGAVYSMVDDFLSALDHARRPGAPDD